MQLKLLVIATCFAFTLAQNAAGHPGEISDPDGFTNLRAARSRESAIVAKVKNGEVIDFKSDRETPWWEVRLGSGTQGYMHSSRIRLHATMAQLADTKPTDEVNEYAKRNDGFDYFPTARGAARGNAKALKTFFGFKGDGAAAETHWEITRAVIHLLGDEKLAWFLRGQSAAYTGQLRELLEQDVFSPFETDEYLQRHFPKTAALLLKGNKPRPKDS